MRRFLIIVLVLCSPLLQAQKNAKELGDFLFKALRMENLRAVHTYIATPDEVLIFSKRTGRSYTTQQAEDFKLEQAETDSSFMRKCKFVLDDGKQRGIVWAKAELVEVIEEIDTYQISSLDESKTIDFGGIQVVFSYEGKKYVLKMETAFNAVNRWRLTGDKLTLSTYKE